MCAVATKFMPAGQSGETVWGVGRAEFEARLRSGDHDFLRHISLSSRDLREAEQLGDAAPVMLGYAHLSLGLQDRAVDLFQLAAGRSQEPYRYEAAAALISILSEQERYPEAESFAARALREYPDDPKLTHAYLNALYRQQKDSELLARMEEAGAAQTRAESAERALWTAVSGSRVNREGWPGAYLDLFTQHRAHDAHSRVWVYLLDNQDIYSVFTEDQIRFFNAKRLLAEGRSVQASEQFSGLANRAPDLVSHEETLWDIYVSGSRSARQSRTAAELSVFASESSGTIRARALEYAGRLYRTAGNYGAASEALRESLTYVAGDDDRRRVSWYLLSSRVRGDPAGTAVALSEVVGSLDVPSYFDDVLSELVTLLVEGRAFDALRSAYDSLRDFASPATLATYELVLAESIRAGLLAVHAERADSLRREYLGRASARSQNVFAALLAATLLGRDGSEVLASARAGDEETGAVDVDASALIDGFTQFGLLDRGYELAFSRPREIAPPVMDTLISRLAAHGKVRESIRLAIRVPSAGALTGENTRFRYPLAFAAVFDSVLANEDVDPWLLYSVVRSESLFDPDIVSSAGAVGLAQLLPSTAMDVARRMQIDPPVLTDPLDNLSVGARYLSMLTEQFGNPFRAVMAYNAGQGRVRDWERRYADLEGVLLHAGIPFDETRNHVRNVVVAAAYYGYLYGNRRPSDTVRFFFAAEVGDS